MPHANNIINHINITIYKKNMNLVKLGIVYTFVTICSKKYYTN